jgi:hypothetical protein
MPNQGSKNPRVYSGSIKPEWEVVQDTMASFQSLIRLRSDDWNLHSWNVFTSTRGGGNISPYSVDMVCSVWQRKESQCVGTIAWPEAIAAREGLEAMSYQPNTRRHKHCGLRTTWKYGIDITHQRRTNDPN